MSEATWVSLFSGGKDSSFALYTALKAGYSVDQLITIKPDSDSYLYHVPAIEITELAAESIGIPLYNEAATTTPTQDNTDSSTRATHEIKPLKTALRSVDEQLNGITGVISGAVASEYQKSRFSAVCEELGLELYAPLWHTAPLESLTAMVEASFTITIVQVAAEGLDENWLGRTLDHQTIDELSELSETYGVHPIGEGGEYETLVTDGPHMTNRIKLEYDTKWDGMRGSIDITNATLM